MGVVVNREKMEEDFEKFCSNEEFDNFAKKNYNKLVNYTNLDPY